VVRQIQELRQPIATLSRVVPELAAALPAEAPRAQIERITSTLSTLQRVVAELPQRARGASPAAPSQRSG